MSHMELATKNAIKSEIQCIMDMLSAIKAEVHADKQHVDHAYIAEKVNRAKFALDWISNLSAQR